MADAAKKTSQKLSDLQLQFEQSEKLLAERTEQASLFERRFNSLGAEMAELNALYQTAEKSRRDLLLEVRESRNAIADLDIQIGSFANEKKKFNETMSGLATGLANEQDNHRATEDKLRQANFALADLNGKLMQQKVIFVWLYLCVSWYLSGWGIIDLYFFLFLKQNLNEIFIHFNNRPMLEKIFFFEFLGTT